MREEIPHLTDVGFRIFQKSNTNHKLEEYKGHENSRNVNYETKEKGAFLRRSVSFRKGKKRGKGRNTSLMEESHGGRSRRSPKDMIFFQSSMIKMKLPVLPYGLSVIPYDFL